MKPVTRRQWDVLECIRSYRDKHGYSPTYEEIAGELGVNKVTVYEHATALIRKGRLRKQDRSSRGLEVVGDSSEDQADRYRRAIVKAMGLLERRDRVAVEPRRVVDAWNVLRDALL